ncbi:MAG: carboxypeptidase-like regulatory domain-containing protein, partial [Candidatus Doudnabacteria bacterium]
MKKTLIYFFIFTCTINLISQHKNPQMEGYVFSDNKPLAGANIIVEGTTIGTITNSEGYYQLTNLPGGNFILRASFIGYKSQEIEVKLRGRQISKINFDLKEDELNLEQIVVTGTRTKHYIKDVPVRTEVITMHEIKNKNACNLYQAL